MARKTPERPAPPAGFRATRAPARSPTPTPPAPRQAEVEEIGGPQGPEPTRYGDWEKNGRCSDF